MARITVSARVRGTRDLRGLARRLAAAEGADLQRMSVQELQEAARPITRQLKAAIRAMPSHHNTGLRRGIAAATRADPRSDGVRFRVESGKLGAKAVMPGLLEESGGWYHPTFGHAPYVFQSDYPWFYSTIEANEPRLVEALDEVLDRFAEIIGL